MSQQRAEGLSGLGPIGLPLPSLTANSERAEFWEILHAALELQHRASTLATEGLPEEAAYSERQAMSLLLEATCLLEADQPALDTVRQLASAGIARLRELGVTQPKPRRARPTRGGAAATTRTRPATRGPSATRQTAEKRAATPAGSRTRRAAGQS